MGRTPEEQKHYVHVKKLMLERDDYRCAHCFCTYALDPHHIVKRSLGGGDDLHNLVTVCRICHNANEDGLLKIELIGGEVKFTRLRGWKP